MLMKRYILLLTLSVCVAAAQAAAPKRPMGTEAAAVTVIEATETAMPEEPKRFHADRPFLYIISEQSTGAIFFIGQFTGGVTADVRTGIIGTKAEPRTDANNLIYNLSGQRLTKEPARGLYIKNGKVMIK